MIQLGSRCHSASMAVQHRRYWCHRLRPSQKIGGCQLQKRFCQKVSRKEGKSHGRAPGTPSEGINPLFIGWHPTPALASSREVHSGVVSSRLSVPSKLRCLGGYRVFLRCPFGDT